MEKRTSTVSARIPSDLEFQLQAIAQIRDTTLSDLICSTLAELVEQERVRYLKLRSAFECAPGLPGIPAPDLPPAALRATPHGDPHA